MIWPASARVRRFIFAQRGATAAEFALVVPLVIALTLGVINVSLLVFTNSALYFATDDTARYSSIHNSCNNTAAQSHGASAYVGPGTSVSFTCVTTSAACSGGSYVTGTTSFTFFTGLTSTPLTLSSTSCYPPAS
jgi:Flp pilus assembly protein TadG